MNLVNISYFPNQKQNSGIYNFSYNQRQLFHLHPKLIHKIITNPTTPLYMKNPKLYTKGFTYKFSSSVNNTKWKNNPNWGGAETQIH